MYSPKYLFVLLLLCYFNSQAQNSYIRKPTASNVSKTNISFYASDTIRQKPITNWVGKKIIFAPIKKNYQQFGYTDFQGGSGFKGRPSYEECVGKMATITSVKADSGEYKIKVKMNDGGKIYTGTTRNGAIARIVFVEDMDSAKTRYEGKSFYMKKDILYTWDDVKEKTGFLLDQRMLQVSVTGVYIGFDDNAPIQLWLKSSKGDEGYININLSNSNLESGMEFKSLFSSFFYRKNPKDLCNCPVETWQLIKSKQVEEGMTIGQAKMSWGEPKEIIQVDDTHVKYKYNNNGYLYFENGVLKAMAQ